MYIYLTCYSFVGGPKEHVNVIVKLFFFLNLFSRLKKSTTMQQLNLENKSPSDTSLCQKPLGGRPSCACAAQSVWEPLMQAQ